MKGALFLGAGGLLNHYETVDGAGLHGRGRAMPIGGLVFLLGGLGLAGLPPFGTWAGKTLIEHTAEVRGWWWVMPLGVLASALTGGAVLRVWLHVFRGAGRPAAHAEADAENAETRGRLGALPWTMTSPPVVLLRAALALTLVPGLGQAMSDAAASFSRGTGGAAPALWTGAGISLAWSRVSPRAWWRHSESGGGRRRPPYGPCWTD